MSEAWSIEDEERRQTRRSFRDYLSRAATQHVERGLYAYTTQYSQIHNLAVGQWSAVYRDRVADLLWNLRQDRRRVAELVALMEDNPLHGYNLPFLTSLELDPDRWEDVTQYIQTTADVLANMPTIQRDPCPECGCVDYFHEQHQTRGADEPATHFFTCRDCHYVIMINC